MIRLLLLCLTMTLAISAIGCHDLLTWVLEAAPVLIAIPCIIRFRRQVSWPLAILIAVHAVVLCLGAHYTYERVPGGTCIPFPGTGGRNNYDKVGHLFQGITPAFILAGIIHSSLHIRQRLLRVMVVVLSVLGISALYEIVEMVAGMTMGGQADAFLGTQGFVWDTQTDMLMALIGAFIGLGWRRMAAPDGAPAEVVR